MNDERTLRNAEGGQAQSVALTNGDMNDQRNTGDAGEAQQIAVTESYISDEYAHVDGVSIPVKHNAHAEAYLNGVYPLRDAWGEQAKRLALYEAYLNGETTLRYAEGPMSGTIEAEDAQVVPGHRRSLGAKALVAIREIVETVVLALVIFLVVRACIQNFKVDGSSMDPSLQTGQYLLVSKLTYAKVDLGGIAPLLSKLGIQTVNGIVYPFGTPHRGDIIVFHFPRDPSRDFIKRVIALPGETVEVKSGKVLVNNSALAEPYILQNPAYSKEPVVVPQDNYYVLGDNRNNSSDSHVWGPVPVGEIVGKAWISYWPRKEWGFIPNYEVEAVPSNQG